MTVFMDLYKEQVKNVGGSDIDDHLEFLFESAREHDGPIVELGTRTGVSTRAFLAAIEGSEKELWSVDIQRAQVPDWWFQNAQWNFLQSDSVAKVAQEWIPQEIGLLFIDSSHEYELTIRELHLYVPRVRPDGVVLMHDVRWLPPGQSLPEPGGPVKDALDNFCADTGREWEVRYGWHNGYGLGILRP
jgi:predicted O-methyltransferase YrrM